MKEKIEEILLRNNNWKADEDEVEIFGVEFSRETMDKVINELSTLIQQEREEAVKNTILSIMSKVPTIMPHDKPDYILRSDFDRAIKEVESEGKE